MRMGQHVVFDAIGSFYTAKKDKNPKLRSFSWQFSEATAFAYVVSQIENCRNIQCLDSLYNINLYTTFNVTCAIIRPLLLGPHHRLRGRSGTPGLPWRLRADWARRRAVDDRHIWYCS